MRRGSRFIVADESFFFCLRRNESFPSEEEREKDLSLSASRAFARHFAKGTGKVP